uniref:Uncharacterized protein n=1 Tax=Anguilla anguilla TaxID=7936 RepID=A0A0E9UXM1_ANGAN
MPKCKCCRQSRTIKGFSASLNCACYSYTTVLRLNHQNSYFIIIKTLGGVLKVTKAA